MGAETEPKSDNFYWSAVAVAGFQILTAIYVISWSALGSCLSPSFEPLLSLALFIPYVKLLWSRPSSLLGLTARCAHTCALAVWGMVFLSPWWLPGFSQWAMYRGAWKQGFLFSVADEIVHRIPRF